MSGAVMRTNNFPELLDTPLRKIFFQSLMEVKPEYIFFSNIMETRRNFDDTLRMAEFGQVPKHVEGDVTFYEDAIEGQIKRYKADEYVLGYSVTEVMREDDQHGVMVRLTKSLRKSFRNLFEVIGYGPLNRSGAALATADDFGYDGLPLASAVHPNLGDGNTQSNTFAVPMTLTQANVEAAVIQFSKWTGEKGLPALVTPLGS